MSAILREGLKNNEKLQIQRPVKKKHKLVSKIPSSRVILLKLMMEWKLLEQQVDRAHGAEKKKTGSSSTQILG